MKEKNEKGRVKGIIEEGNSHSILNLERTAGSMWPNSSCH